MYNNGYNFYEYLQQLDHFFRLQQKEIEQLKNRVNTLQQEVVELKKKPATNIEKVEYKFDQLKVETLEGTLNIGLNPYHSEQVEDFAVKQGKLSVPKSIPQDVQGYVRKAIQDYLNKNGYQSIRNLQEKLGVPVNDAYYDFMIQDVNRQLDGRIQFYLEQVHPNEWSNESQSKEASDRVIEKMKQDIESAFAAFIQHLPKEWNGD
ncbi:spore germination protein GerPC [Bacillus salitolerans]|uniref:Spore germination protein GerPC n=1 Tax=Bacillus salitolerans TaxID=1437434 RepID=A0ABW4LKG6_9BACI